MWVYINKFKCLRRKGTVDLDLLSVYATDFMSQTDEIFEIKIFSTGNLHTNS